MSQQVKVDRDLIFQNSAAVTQNVQGRMLEELSHDSDRFVGKAIDSVYFWNSTTNGTASTIAHAVEQGGSALFTPGSADNDSCMLSTNIIYSGTYKAVCEWRVKIANVSGVTVFVGFVDELEEDNTYLAIDYTGGTTFRTTATDACGFVIAGEYLTSSIMCCSTQTAGGDTTPVDSGTDWEDGEIKNLRVEMDGTTANFWLDGVQVASIPSSVTAATLMCATMQVMTVSAEGGGTATANALRFDAWQEEI